MNNQITGNVISGRKKNDVYDFYETPTWATERVVEQMLIDGIVNKYDNILEPCSGAGAITNVLKQYFENVEASDIQGADYIVGKRNIDVYDINDNMCDVVITNPPYNLMTKENMLNEFLRIASKKVILLLNIFYLSSKDRKQMLENSPLRHIYIHSDRVTMYPYGEPKPKNGGTKMFAWFVWDKEYKGKPTISWI